MLDVKFHPRIKFTYREYKSSPTAMMEEPEDAETFTGIKNKYSPNSDHSFYWTI